jgi:cell division protease FtsH
MTRSELENKIAVLLGGRVAEEIVFDEVSTGAQNDLAKATDIAASMVKAYGMSDKLGQVSFDRDRHSMLMPAPAPSTRGDYSEETSREIDCEVRAIIDEQHARVRDLLERRRAALRDAAALLLERETIGGEELADVLARHAGEENTAAALAPGEALGGLSHSRERTPAPER